MALPKGPPTVEVDGEKIRTAREKRGLTQLYVAEVVGVTVDTVSRWENNRTQAVKRENAEALAQALEVELPRILREGPAAETAEPPAPARRTRRSLWALLAAAAAVATLAAVWALRQQAVFEVTAERRLPPYTPPGTSVPVVVELQAVEGNGRRVVLREKLPPGWSLVEATPPPDQGPSDGLVKWLLPLENGRARVTYVAEAPAGGTEGTAHRFAGEVVTPRGTATPVGGEARIDLEYVHWADQDGDFQLDDSELLDALERLEAAPELGIPSADLRRLWGAPEYEWDSEARRFVPLR